MLKSGLPSLASLWPDSSANVVAAVTSEGDAERPDSEECVYSHVQRRETTYEMMRECPEIIEEVVEMRYNTGTIVKPHVRHGMNRVSLQQVFDISLNDTADAKEAGSDSGVSSKNSDTGEMYDVPTKDTYDLPKSQTYDLPRGPGPASGRDHKEVQPEQPENFYLEPKTVEEIERDRKRIASEANGAGNMGRQTRKKPMPAPKPESLKSKSSTDVNVLGSSVTGMTLGNPPKLTAAINSKMEGVQAHKSRSLQNLQQCFAQIEIPKPKVKTKKSFRLHPKPKSEETDSKSECYTTCSSPSVASPTLDQCFSDNFVLMPSQRFQKNQHCFKPPYGDRRDILNDSIESRDQGECGLEEDDAVGEDEDEMDNDELEIEAAIDEALDDEVRSSVAETRGGTLETRGSTLERGYERLPYRSRSVDGCSESLFVEPLYANRHELRQSLIEDLRHHCQKMGGGHEPETPSISDAGSDVFRAIPVEITSMDTLPKPPHKSKHDTYGGDKEKDAGKMDSETLREQPETYITLNLKDYRVPRASLKPAPYRKNKMRKSSSMSDLLPTVFRSRDRGPPNLPNTMSQNTAARLEEAHRSLKDHAKQTGKQSRPSSAASSAYLSAWLTLASLWSVLCRWAGVAGGAVGSAVNRATSPISDWIGIKYMSVHRNHPWLPDLVSQPDLDYWVQRTKKGSNGFEELRKYIKHGGDFCKELAVILQERSDLEINYAKSLQKLSAKLLKASKDGLGTVNQAWQMVGAEMEYESDIHKTLAVAMTEELVKPLRVLIDTQHKVRKSVEGMVDKTAKNLAEWRSAEAKAKKLSYQCARENEKAEEQALEVRLGRGKQLSEKETNKVESRRQKTGDAMSKADTDYYTFCLRGERARLEWETAVNKGSQCFQALEEERLVKLKAALQTYHQNMRSLGPKMIQGSERLTEPVACADVSRDVQTVINVKGSGHNIPEQLLPDFYAEDMTNVMNRERRKKALEQFVHLIRQDVERERRGKHGVENLAKALQDTPHFGNEGSKKDVHEKLQHMRAMLAYLEASRHKIQSSLSELGGLPRPQHPLSKHIEYHKDRQGMTQSILKVPAWVRLDPLDLSPDGSPDWGADRGKADGTSHQPDSDFDEFSSQGDEREYQTPTSVSQEPLASPPPADSSGDVTSSPSPDQTPIAPSTGRCKVLYDYKANMYDELTIKNGDVINIHDKQDDGWWLGELNGTVGIFPATYVQELT